MWRHNFCLSDITMYCLILRNEEFSSVDHMRPRIVLQRRNHKMKRNSPDAYYMGSSTKVMTRCPRNKGVLAKRISLLYPAFTVNCRGVLHLLSPGVPVGVAWRRGRGQWGPSAHATTMYACVRVYLQYLCVCVCKYMYLTRISKSYISFGYLYMYTYPWFWMTIRVG